MEQPKFKIHDRVVVIYRNGQPSPEGTVVGVRWYPGFVQYSYEVKYDGGSGTRWILADDMQSVDLTTPQPCVE